MAAGRHAHKKVHKSLTVTIIKKKNPQKKGQKRKLCLANQRPGDISNKATQGKEAEQERGHENGLWCSPEPMSGFSDVTQQRTRRGFRGRPFPCSEY